MSGSGSRRACDSAPTTRPAIRAGFVGRLLALFGRLQQRGSAHAAIFDDGSADMRMVGQGSRRQPVPAPHVPMTWKLSDREMHWNCSEREK